MLILTAWLLGAAALGTADERSRRYSQPVVPSQDALNRLNLKLAWRTYVPTNGRRDGLESVQVLDGSQVLVQTRDGETSLLDGKDGTTLWQVHLGTSGRISHRPAFDGRSVFAVRGKEVYALDRKTGKTKWTYQLPHDLSTAPLADDQMLYVCLVTKDLYAYELPEAQLAENKAAREAAAKVLTANAISSAGSGAAGPPAPRLTWSYEAYDRLELPPVQTQNVVAVAGAGGTFSAVNKSSGKVPWRYKTRAHISAPLGQYGNTAYVASQDLNAYAFDVPTGRLLWRFTAGAALRQQPFVNDDAVYVAPFRGGLHCLRRDDGSEIWFNRDGNRFVAANKKFVYGADARGNLLVLDAARGSELGGLPTSDFVVPVSNEVTDRVFLASNDGLVVCLHDRSYPQPLVMKHQAQAEPEKPKPAPKPPAPRPKKKPAADDDDK
jgi:outer membrane protein assembly factor BamB